MRLGFFISFCGFRSNEGIVQIPSIQNQFLTFIGLSLALVSSSQASILNKMSVKEMTRQSKQVQIGEVVSTWVSPEPDQHMFYTYVKVNVTETLKGKPVKEILLRQPGGMYRDPNTNKVTRQKVFGMESFQKGEKALFFITYANDGAPMVMFQGKHQIVKDEATGTEMTVRETKSRDVEFVGEYSMRDGDSKSFYATYDRRPLNEMVLEIQGAMKGDLKN